MTFNKREASDWAQAIGIVLNLLAGSIWFCLTPLIQRERPPQEVKQVDQFFELMHKPIDFAKEEGRGSDNLQARVMGIRCLIYGGFILLLILIPNPWNKRWAFVFCGAVMFGIGAVLFRASRAKAPERRIDIPQPVIADIPAGEALALGEPAGSTQSP